jgi:hypothetical protein
MNKAYCNNCGGRTNHEVLHKEITSWQDENSPVYGSDRYETLKCLGCDSIKLKHTSVFSERDENHIS